MVGERRNLRGRSGVANAALRRGLSALLLALTLGTAVSGVVSAAPDFADDAFASVWTRTDAPVLSTSVARSWFWGPQANSGPLYERYLDAPDQERLVQYFDKGRMEINDPAGDRTNPWFVTSGLLDRELISGRIQIGDDRYLNAGAGAAIPVAGDPDNTFPTYADLQQLVDQGQPDRNGQSATTVFQRTGMTTRPEATGDSGATFARYVTYTGPNGTAVGYNIPAAFWTFMNQSGLIQSGDSTDTANPLFDWLFVLGYPIADPVWVQVKLQGAEQWVLVQPFERRLLTYTPSNPTGWQVEMGNIGQHYQAWRYESTPLSALSGDRTYLAMNDNDQWRYGTSLGTDEIWSNSGISRSFAAGSQLVERHEDTGNVHAVSYWGVTTTGLDLYGSDTLDSNGKVTDSTVYWPPIHYFPNHDPYIGQSWSTKTTAISMNAPPKSMTVSAQVAAWQIVSTPAGLISAWKVDFVEWTENGTGEPVKVSTSRWIAPSVGEVQWISDGFAAQLKSATTLPPKQ
ncbi:MAG TPA: hypothetical protein VF201_16190 [Nitrolancea sp.]